MHELVIPKMEAWILDQLDEGDQQSPRMGPVHDQSLEKHPAEESNGLNKKRWRSIARKKNHLGAGRSPGYLFLYRLRVGLGEQIKQRAAEVVGVTVRVAQLVGDGVQKQVSTWKEENVLVTGCRKRVGA